MHCADGVVQPAPLGNIFLCDFILRIYFLFLCICACVCICHKSVDDLRARRTSRVPWSWSHNGEPADWDVGNYILVLLRVA